MIGRVAQVVAAVVATLSAAGMLQSALGVPEDQAAFGEWLDAHWSHGPLYMTVLFIAFCAGHFVWTIVGRALCKENPDD